MQWTECHAALLSEAFAQVLGRPEGGAMVFARCLAPDVVTRLASASEFAPTGWAVHRVTDGDTGDRRSITADQAVEIREAKGKATLLLVDTERAGAGMDGIYSATREAREEDLFGAAERLALAQITQQHSREARKFAERAITKAGRHGLYAVSRWAVFDFLCHSAAGTVHPGEHLYRIGLWPVLASDSSDPLEQLGTSEVFMERLLGPENAWKTPASRIADLRVDPQSERSQGDLERFLLSVDAEPRFAATQGLADRRDLWIGNLLLEPTTEIRGLELTSWRNRNGTVARWTGLDDNEEPDEPPDLPDATGCGS